MVAFSVHFWSATFDFIGKMSLAIMALLVHEKVLTEQKIDSDVIGQMKLEKKLGLAAVVLFIASYLLEFWQ